MYALDVNLSFASERQIGPMRVVDDCFWAELVCVCGLRLNIVRQGSE